MGISRHPAGSVATVALDAKSKSARSALVASDGAEIAQHPSAAASSTDRIARANSSRSGAVVYRCSSQPVFSKPVVSKKSGNQIAIEMSKNSCAVSHPSASPTRNSTAATFRSVAKNSGWRSLQYSGSPNLAAT